MGNRWGLMTADEHEWKGKRGNGPSRRSRGIYQGIVQRWSRYLFPLLLLFLVQNLFRFLSVTISYF